MQVYEAAVTEAQQGGGISQKERALLNRLRDSLGVSISDGEAIEVQMQARLTE
jgi:tellurite resistance protein